jgi:hypothetical protein
LTSVYRVTAALQQFVAGWGRGRGRRAREQREHYCGFLRVFLRQVLSIASGAFGSLRGKLKPDDQHCEHPQDDSQNDAAWDDYSRQPKDTDLHVVALAPFVR